MQEQRSLGKLISHIARNIRWMIQRDLEHIEVGSGPHFLLHLIDRKPGITQNELSRMTNIDKATAAKGLARLERLGFVQRQPAPHDRRVRQLYLTEAGRAVMPHIRDTLRHVTEVCAQDLTTAELDELFRLLGKVEASLGRHIEGSA